MFLVGTKSDLIDLEAYNHQTTSSSENNSSSGGGWGPTTAQIVNQWAQKHGVPSNHIFVTSSKTGNGVNEVFQAVAEFLSQKNQETEDDGTIQEISQVKSSESTTDHSKCLCF